MVNVESIRLIICADQILLLSVPDPLHPNTGILPPLRHPFVKELVSRSDYPRADACTLAVVPTAAAVASVKTQQCKGKVKCAHS